MNEGTKASLGTLIATMLDRRALAAWVSVVAATLSCATASAALSPTPLPSVSVEGTVNAVLRTGDSLYLGGSFASVTPWVGSAIALDAQGEPTAPVFPKIEGGGVRAIVSDGAGGWFVGGSFKRIGGQDIGRLAHVNGVGAVVATFAPQPDGDVLALARNGPSLYAGGVFTSIGGQASTQRLAELDTTTGAVDTTFDPKPQGTVHALVTDGASVFAGGNFFALNGQQAPFLVKLNPADGERDLAFAPSPDTTVFALWHDGANLYVGGDFQIISGSTTTDRLAKLNPATAAVVATFDPNPDLPVRAIRVVGGSVYAAGDFQTIDNQIATTRIAKLDPTSGASDLGFNPNPDAPVHALWDDGTSVYAGGDFTLIDGQSATRRLAKLSPADGSASTAFDPRPDATVRALTGTGATPIAGGDFHRAGTRANTIRNLARIDLATGLVDVAFDPNPDGDVNALVADGTNVLAGGSFLNIDAQAATPRLAKVDGASGAVDAAFNPAPTGPVHALALAGASVFAGGEFAGIDGQFATRQLAKVSTADGSVSLAFNPAPDNPASNPSAVYALWHDGSSLYAGGSFRVIDAQPNTQRLARLDPVDGTADLNFNPNMNFLANLGSFSSGDVRTLWHDGTSLYAGGDFQQVDGQLIGNLAKVNPANGAADAAFKPNPGASSGGQAVRALWGDGASLFVGGRFDQIVGAGGLVQRIAKLDPANATVDPTFAPNPDEGVLALTGLSTTIFAGGLLDTAGGVEHEGLAIFGPPRPANSAPPAVSGTPQPGSTLTCSDGTWSDATVPFARRWLHDGAPLAGETGTSYAVQAGDVGHQITCEVTARNGTGPSAPATSAAVTGEAVPSPPPPPPPPPAVQPPPPPVAPPPPPPVAPLPTTTPPLSATATLRTTTVSCKRARTTSGKTELRCTLRVPARATATSIRLTAKAGTKVVARRTLRLRNRAASFRLPATSRTATLKLGAATVVKKLRPR